MGNSPYEPSADMRTFARNCRDMYMALVLEGFTPKESLGDWGDDRKRDQQGGRLMRYMGGKFRQRRDFVPAILGYTPNRDRYLEPFVGGGWMLEAMAPHFQSVIAGDTHQDLIMMWSAAYSGWVPPEKVSKKEHQELRSAPPSALRGFVGFGCSFGGDWFKGYAQDSPGHNDYPARASSRSVVRTASVLPPDTTFICTSYERHQPKPGEVVYADPPYMARRAEFSTSRGFNHAGFWKTMDDWVERGACVFVSEFDAPRHWIPLVVSSQAIIMSSNSRGGSKQDPKESQRDTLWVPRGVDYG